MKVTILGSGTSTGVPEIGCTCEVCTSADPRDHRLRTSALVETDDARILIDCGPDFRAQVLGLPFKKIDGVLITHEHYDHVGGLDDLRPFCRFGEVPIYAEAYTAERLRNRMPYCFVNHNYPGVPNIPLQEIEPGRTFRINRTSVTPLRVMHGRLPILGYRIENMGYITDMLTMPDESYEQLCNLDVLVNVNPTFFLWQITMFPQFHLTMQGSFSVPLPIKNHDFYFTIFANVHSAYSTNFLRAKETYFIHMSHHIGLQAEVEKQLPPHVHFAFDGLEII